MRIGILGGTFDPIHNGHLQAAEQARHAQRLDRVLFVPAHRSPLKPATSASTHHRLAMVRLAIRDNPAFSLSTVDVERPPPSYAIDTVAALQRVHPNAAFVFLIGADQLADLPQWRAPEELLHAVPVVALTRPGAANAIADALLDLSPDVHARITLQEIPAVDISASAIRGRIATGETIRHLTPAAVATYIEQHRLYLSPGSERGS